MRGGNPMKTRGSLRAYISIARPDHSVKNVFVLPGIIIALTVSPPGDWTGLALRIAIGLLSVTLIACSNYVINEVMDAPFDRSHPIKHLRPVASGEVSVAVAYAEWLVLFAAGMLAAWFISIPFFLTMAALWVMGSLYNIPPIRSKDIPYVDVLTESINNPLRMLAGWYITLTQASPPISLLVAYWMVGCYFMAIKRWAEYREFDDAAKRTAYRRAFAFYDERRLLVSIMFYGSFGMLMFGVFIMRYRMELILAFPLIALVMAIYFSLAFKPDSAVQRPETLYREPALMASVVACTVLLVVLLFVDIPALPRIFAPLTMGLHPQARP